MASKYSAFDQAVTQLDTASFDTAAEEFLNPTDFNQAVAELDSEGFSAIGDFDLAEGQSSLTAQDYYDRTFSRDYSAGSQTLKYYLNGVDPRNFNDDQALNASKYAENKADEIKQYIDENYPSIDYSYYGSYAPKRGTPTMSKQTAKELEAMFRYASRNLQLDPDYYEQEQKWSQDYRQMAMDSWDQYDRHIQDPDNVKFPELHRAGVGEAQVVPQSVLRGFMDNIPKSLVLSVAELSSKADPVMRGTEEARSISDFDKKVKAQYSAYLQNHDYMGGYKRIPGQSSNDWTETLGETGGMVLQFLAVPLKSGKAFMPEAFAWESGKRGINQIMSKLGIKNSTLSTQTMKLRPSYKNPLKEGMSRVAGRAGEVAKGTLGYSLARQEKGIVGSERVDDNYYIDKIEKEVSRLAIEIPSFVVMGEMFHQASKGLVPAFYRANEQIAKKLGTPEAFQKEFNAAIDRAAVGKQSQADDLFIAQVTSMARDLGVKAELISTGQRGFTFRVLEPRKWTEIFPILNDRLSRQIQQLRPASQPKQPRVEKETEFSVKKEPTKMEQLATETGESIKKLQAPEPPPAKPMDQVDRGMNFVSGLERSPADASSAIAGGGQIGVRINDSLSQTMKDKIIDLTKLKQNVFIEHGLYKADDMKFAEGDSFDEIALRLEELVKLGADPEYIYMVLPDALDSAFKTKELADFSLSQFKRKDALADIKYIYPMQRMGAGGKFASESLPNPADGLVIGIPGNFSRVNASELRKLFQTGMMEGHNHFHLLGVDPASVRGKELIQVIRQENPNAIVSADTALGRTSVNAVKKENMEFAARELGLLEKEENENWTDWVDEIWDTKPLEMGWSMDEMNNLATAVSYGQDEAADVFRLLNENNTLYEIEEILGNELGADPHGTLTRDTMRNILDAIWKKTTRGEWIQSQVAKAVPVEPEPAPTEPEPEPEPAEPEPYFKAEPPSDTNPLGFEPWEGEMPKFKDGKIYKINKNGIIYDAEKFVFHDGKKVELTMDFVEFADGKIAWSYDYSTPISGAHGSLGIRNPNIADSFAQARVNALNVLLKRAYEDTQNTSQSKAARKELDQVIAKFKDEITIDLGTAKSSFINTDPVHHYLDITDDNIDMADNVALYQGWRYANILNEKDQLEEDYPFYDEFERVIRSRDPIEFLQDIGWPTEPDALYRDYSGDVFKFKNLSRYGHESPDDFKNNEFYLVNLIYSFKPNRGTNIKLRERIDRGIEWLEQWRKDHPRKKVGWKSLVFPNAQLLSDKIVIPAAHAEYSEMRELLNAKNGLTYEAAMEWHLKIFQDLMGRPHPKQIQSIENLPPAEASEDSIKVAIGLVQQFMERPPLLNPASPLDDLLDMVDTGDNEANKAVRNTITELLADFKINVENASTTPFGELVRQADEGIYDPRSNKVKDFPVSQIKETIKRAYPKDTPARKFINKALNSQSKAPTITAAILRNNFVTIGRAAQTAFDRQQQTESEIPKEYDELIAQAGQLLKEENYKEQQQDLQTIYDIALKDPSRTPELKAQIALYEETISRLEEPVEPTIETDPGKKEREENGNPFDEAEQKALAKIQAKKKGQSVVADKDIIAAQKEYLNEKLASALKEAPDDPYSLLSTKEMQDLEALRKDYESIKPKHADTITGHTSKQLDNLKGDYYYYREAYVQYFNELLATGKLPYIELNIPYDGVFRIVNSKEAIKKFMERVGKNASKIGIAKASAPDILKPPKPTSFRSGKNDVGKAAALFAATKHDKRDVLRNVVEYSDAIISTDGRRIFIADAKIAEKLKTGVKKINNDEKRLPDGEKYPNAIAVIPKEILGGNNFFPLDDNFIKPRKEFQIHKEDLLHYAISINVGKPSYGEAMAFHRGTDGKLAVRSAYDAMQFSSANHDPHAFDEFVLQPQYLMDIAKAAVELKSDVIEFRITDPHQPMIVLFRPGAEGFPRSYLVQMPMRKDYKGGTHISGYKVEENFRKRNLKDRARQYIRNYRTQRNLDAINKQRSPYLKEIDAIFSTKRNETIFEDQIRHPMLTDAEYLDIQKAFILGQFETDGFRRLADLGSLRGNWTKLHDYMAEFYMTTLRNIDQAEVESRLEAIRLQEVADVNEHILAGGFIDSLNKDPDSSSLIGKPFKDILDIRGFIIEAQALRNPRFEYHTMVGIRNGKIVDALTWTQRHPSAVSSTPGEGINAALEWMDQTAKKYDQVYMLHNHPSGVVDPSPADLGQAKKYSQFMGNYAGMIIINHGEYTFVDKNAQPHYGNIGEIQSQYDLLRHPAVADPILNLPFEPETAPKVIDDFIKSMDGTNPDSDKTEYLGVYLDSNHKVKGVARLPFATADFTDILGKMRQMASELGAKNVVLYEPPARNIAEAEKQVAIGTEIQLMLANDYLVQFIRAGSEWIKPSADWVPYADVFVTDPDIEIVSEGESGYGKGENTPLESLDARSSEPVQSAFEYIDANGNVVKQEFNLDPIPPIQLPEALALLKAWKGEYPTLRKLRKARGQLVTWEGMDWKMEINPDIFKMRNDQAAKTIMHEWGHLIDFLDDMTMKRGNLLGRMTSARESKKKTIPAFMGMPVTDFTMTQKERNKIRYDARKQIIEELENEALSWAKGKGVQLNPQNILDSYGEALALDEAGGVKMNADLASAKPKMEARIKEATRKRYLQLLTQRFAEGGMIENSAIHAELIDLMDWWKPIPQNASKSFRAYRQSSKELYADAMSVLFNAPNELQRRAPQFWQSFFAYLDKKPDLARKLRKAWEFIRDNKPSGVIRARLDRRRKQWKSLEHQFIAEDAEQRAAYKPLVGTWQQLQVLYYDYAFGVKSRAKIAKDKFNADWKWTEDPEALWDMHPFANNEPFLFIDQVHQKIVGGLKEQGLTIEDFGMYLFARRILFNRNRAGTGRAQLANPEGITPKQAKEELLVMSRDLGSEKMYMMEYFAGKYREMFFNIYDQLFKAGMFTAEQFYTQIVPNKDNYATFAVADYFLENKWIPSGIKRQVGTFKEIINPFTAMSLKAVTALKLLQWQNAKKATVDLMQQYFSEEIREVPFTLRFDRNIMAKKKVYDEAEIRSIESQKYNEGVISLMRDGKLYKYIVPWDVAQAELGVDPVMNEVAARWLNRSFRMIFYPMYITFNAGFQWLWSPIRDFDRTNRALSVVGNKVSRLRLMKAYKQGFRESWNRMKGDVSPLIQEMMRVKAIGTPFDNFALNAQETEETIFGMLLEQNKLLPKKDFGGNAKLQKALKPLIWIGNNILHLGQTFETLAKVAPYTILTRDLGVAPEEAGELVRNHAGVPPYWVRGKAAYIPSALFPFINVAMKGYLMDARLALGKRKGLKSIDRERMLGLGPLTAGSGGSGGGRIPPRNPTFEDPVPERGGRPRGKKGEQPSGKKVMFSYWFKYARSSGLYTLLKNAAQWGGLGFAIKKAYDYIPTYDKENYNVIPLGYVYRDTDNAVDRFVALTDDNIPNTAKVIYLRFPMDETTKLIAGMQSQITLALAAKLLEDPTITESSSSMIEFIAEQVPGLNPALKIPAAWKLYAMGINPQDPFTGGKVLNYDEEKARGWHGIKAMAKWTADESGITNFVNYDPETDTTLEWSLKNIPMFSGTIGKMVKVSDAGKYETGFNLDDIMDERYSKLKLSYGENTLKMHKKWTRVSGVRTENRDKVVDPSEYETLKDWYKEYSSLHTENKHYVDYIADPKVPAADKKKYEKQIEKYRQVMEDLSKVYLEDYIE